ncbi:MAG TPA: Lrp/AsnC family transcriptional regulator, partial [Rhodanobacteraceae bacterium]|nr:Lrp/AsnC family transcriptional regulator [Rhodanobacteraceae bacterium]
RARETCAVSALQSGTFRRRIIILPTDRRSRSGNCGKTRRETAPPVGGWFMANLDSIDRRLLAELQREGRVTNVELAHRVGLTAPPCLRRVRALEEGGVIRGYHADLDGAKLGYTITVFAMVSLKSQAEEDLKAFEQHMRALADVRECHMLNGEIDFILKIVSKDLQSFQEFLTSKLTPAPNVASVKTSLTIRTAKQQPGVPLE